MASVTLKRGRDLAFQNAQQSARLAQQAEAVCEYWVQHDLLSELPAGDGDPVGNDADAPTKADVLEVLDILATQAMLGRGRTDPADVSRTLLGRSPLSGADLANLSRKHFFPRA